MKRKQAHADAPYRLPLRSRALLTNARSTHNATQYQLERATHEIDKPHPPNALFQTLLSMAIVRHS